MEFCNCHARSHATRHEQLFRCRNCGGFVRCEYCGAAATDMHGGYFVCEGHIGASLDNPNIDEWGR